MSKPRIASWNSRAKYYVITEPGKKGIQSRTDVGEPPPKDCELKGCNGNEYKRHQNLGQPDGNLKVTRGAENKALPDDVFNDIESQKETFKKKDSEPELDSSLKPKPHELAEKESAKTDWFSALFGG